MSMPSSDAMAPLFDLQVNGYAGVDFNGDNLSAESLHRACERLRADGVAQALATVITDQPEAMRRRLARLAELRARDPLVEQTIAGLHVEGPFISSVPGYVGAHPAAATCDASIELTEQLLEAGGGLICLVTLAPERDAGGAVTRLLAERGVVVSAGHCDPTLQELRTAIDAGLSMFTHLGNGCPLLMHRHDNIIQRVLSLADRLWVMFIADGVHVPLVALQNYLRLVGPERAIIVSDAIAAAGMGPGTYQLAGQEVVVDDRLATWAADRSHLIGSACPLRQAVANLTGELGLPTAAVERMVAANPSAALRR
jgi:N-acetylglucosamine-6-phosphate deacetylase